jgi:hypothetical protein
MLFFDGIFWQKNATLTRTTENILFPMSVTPPLAQSIDEFVVRLHVAVHDLLLALLVEAGHDCEPWLESKDASEMLDM